MNEVTYAEIRDDDAGQRLDNFLMRKLKGVPRSHIYRIIRGGEVRVNKKRAAASTRLLAGDRVRIPPIRTAAMKTVHVGEKLEGRLKESILFEDSSLLVINKPAGIAVHGGSGLSLGVIEALRKTRTDLTYLELIHRLDRDTSGCLLLAKKRSVLRAVQALLEAREVKKIYWALLLNPWSGKKTRLVDVPLEKNTLKSGERIVEVGEGGKASQTHFKLLENYRDACWVEAFPKTGRTHQIRVHSAYLRHPILGDKKYGATDRSGELELNKTRLYLHARSIQFTLNGKTHLYEAEPDRRFSDAIEQLRARSFLSHE
ncbi:RluA family pseudouridine synthase [Legionella spiritensis]|uniref:Pseudouridine synthase n=1 Tax=Legionella spiritensis TaxID=452 RepID=A0A0W0Z5T0_LEGSP|nr:RluA family pseudouridine synthase [Legionella spiritensis]KTD64512.1 ribosomal large subunit (23S rRNA) pseudouridine synthase C [Legionella spiritensis]SNV33146.1 ribosomal large subunit (23S rRNA) pseudouridine synthase C [Legionella spiritensis]